MMIKEVGMLKSIFELFNNKIHIKEIFYINPFKMHDLIIKSPLTKKQAEKILYEIMPTYQSYNYIEDENIKDCNYICEMKEI